MKQPLMRSILSERTMAVLQVEPAVEVLCHQDWASSGTWHDKSAKVVLLLGLWCPSELHRGAGASDGEKVCVCTLCKEFAVEQKP